MTRYGMVILLGLGIGTATAQDDLFGKGVCRVSYTNVHGCKTEFQCFDTSFTTQKLDNALSFLHRIGSKDRGMENEFTTFRVYDWSNKSDTRPKLTAYAQQKVKEFEKSVERLRKAPVSKEFEPLKAEMLENHTKKLRFERIFADWYKTGDDKEFRKKVTSFYSDVYVLATLDKTLGLKNDLDKWRYAYAELYDIFNAHVFSYDRLIQLQNKFLTDYKIDVVVDPECARKS